MGESPLFVALKMVWEEHGLGQRKRARANAGILPLSGAQGQNDKRVAGNDKRVADG